VFAAMSRMMLPWLSGYVGATVRDRRIDAEDVAATVLANLFLTGGPYRFQGGEAFRRWLCVVARNTVRKELRARSAAPRSLDGLEEPCDRGRFDPALRLAALEEARERARAGLLLAVLCWVAFLEASEREREALVLHHGRGLTYREVGARLGMRPELAAGMVRRARNGMLRRITGIVCIHHQGRFAATMAPR
jgi:RNA polymerase sigma factor (sigma-70 family)